MDCNRDICSHFAGDEEQTIKVASKKDTKNGAIKLKKPPPKHNKPGNWMDGSVLEGKLSRALPPRLRISSLIDGLSV